MYISQKQKTEQCIQNNGTEYEYNRDPNVVVESMKTEENSLMLIIATSRSSHVKCIRYSFSFVHIYEA